MISSYFGHRMVLGTLRRRHPLSLNGVTFRGLIQVAAELPLISRPAQVKIAQLGQLRLPAILHWDMNHFVALKAVRRRGIVVHDPACGERFYHFAEASKHLTGVAL